MNQTGAEALRSAYLSDGLELLAEAGSGGFGQVYRARHIRLAVDVAIKVLAPHLREDPDVCELFEREARIMARLDHPNLLRIYDYRVGPEGPYIVTEWMSAGALSAPVANAATLAAVGAAGASALEALHGAGVLHRDIKPENLLVRHDGRCKVGDFGISLPTDATALKGALVGTPPYMAPEHFGGPGALGPALDVYSLGVSLYQLWMSSLPFEAANIPGLIARVLDGRPDHPLDRRSGLTPAIQRLIMQMMARAPSERPAPAQVVAALSSFEPASELSEPLGAVGSWILAEEIYRSTNWLGYLTYHAQTGRASRLSVLQETSALNAQLVLRSAERASQWSHESLTRVLDWGSTAGRPFVVFGSPGQSLDSQVAAGGVQTELEALRLVADIAEGVAFLESVRHTYQMVEPGSVYSRPGGDGWLLGWPCYCAPLGDPAAGQRVYVTPYAAPEIASLSTFASATDVFGLGAVLAFALTGQGIRWLDAHDDHDRMIAERLPRLTSPTRQLLTQALSPNPAKRPTACEVAGRARDIAGGLTGFD